MAGSKTILFIEDDRVISAMYTRMLERKGYKVEFAYDGTTGLEMARAKHYDLILLDIMMPKMTGIQVLKEFRGADNSGGDGTKIIILTNLAQDATSKEALAAAADGYIIKADIVPSQLAEVIADVLAT